jgi:hypothetical protein
VPVAHDPFQGTGPTTSASPPSRPARYDPFDPFREGN